MNSKKTLLSLINGGALLGTSAGQQVTFKYASTIAKAIGAAADNGSLIFAADATSGAGAIWAGAELVSSRVLDYAIADSAEKDHSQKTVTLTYIDKTIGLTTKTFDLIDEAGLKAYFAGSKTIALNDSSIFEVKTKANGGLDVDATDGLFVKVSDFFAVDGSTIVQDATSKKISTALGIKYVANNPGGDAAHIALVDNADNEIDKVWVSDIIGNGVVDHTSYNPATNTLSIFFKRADGTTEEVKIDLSDLFDIDDWAVKSDSTDFLAMTIDSSAGTAEIGVKKADVTFTAKTSTEDASLTVDTTNGEILVASDAIPAIVDYVKATQKDKGIAVESKNDYIDASIDANDNKKINLKAQVANLTVGKVGDADSTLSGVADKLVDGDDAASKVQSFVNARISEEVAKLDASIDSAAGTFISAGVKEVDGKITSVVVHETVGTITGTYSEITGNAGLISGDDVAEAVSTFVNGRLDASIQALDADISTAVALNADNNIYTRGTLTEVDGVVTAISVENQIAETTVTDYVAEPEAAPTFTVNTKGLLTGTDATNLAHYVDEVAEMIKAQSIESLDASISDTDVPNFISTHIEQKDGKIIVSTVDSSYGAYNYTAATHTFGTATDGLAKVADTQTFVQNVIESLDLANDVADASAHDSKNYIKSVISETNGIVKNESLTTTYGDYTNHTNGIATVEDTSTFVQNLLTWTLI